MPCCFLTSAVGRQSRKRKRSANSAPSRAQGLSAYNGDVAIPRIRPPLTELIVMVSQHGVGAPTALGSVHVDVHSPISPRTASGVKKRLPYPELRTAPRTRRPTTAPNAADVIPTNNDDRMLGTSYLPANLGEDDATRDGTLRVSAARAVRYAVREAVPMLGERTLNQRFRAVKVM